jgi:hypothetical protein
VRTHHPANRHSSHRSATCRVPFAYRVLVRSDLDFVDDFYAQSTPLRNQFNWLPLLLFLTGFVTTVYMVNLLIAMMTSTYERIRSKSHDWCAARPLAPHVLVASHGDALRPRCAFSRRVRGATHILTPGAGVQARHASVRFAARVQGRARRAAAAEPVAVAVHIHA